MADLEFFANGLLFPFVVDDQGGLEVADADTTVRQMLLQILFTSPGERVNRPDFGVGVRDLVFEPDTQFLASWVRRRLVDNIATYIGDQVTLTGLSVDAEDLDEPMLVIRITYAVRGGIDGEQELQVQMPRMAS